MRRIIFCAFLMFSLSFALNANEPSSSTKNMERSYNISFSESSNIEKMKKDKAKKKAVKKAKKATKKAIKKAEKSIK